MAKLLLCYAILCYCRIQETPGAPEDTRGDKEGHQKDRRAQRHHEDRRAQRGIGRDTKRTGGNSGGIGAGRKATGIQQGSGSTGMRSISTSSAHRSTARRTRRGAHTGELQHGEVRDSQTTARRARRSAHAGELQHGTGLQHGAHGAVRIPARRGALQHPSNAQCARKPGHYRAQQGAEQLGRD
jgi:hypothetical protein